MRIIPAIDIIEGKCVRLTQGDYTQKKVYNENPVEVAKAFEDAGFEYLHLVDLDGAKQGKVVNWDVIKSICNETTLTVDFGGGIKKEEELLKLFELGVSQVNLGSIAVKNKLVVFDWIIKFGGENMILSADVKNEMIAIHGWQETSDLHIEKFAAEYIAQGLTNVVCTDISTDGTLQGPNVSLYQKLMDNVTGINLIASGGVGNIDHIKALKSINVDGVIIGKAIYEGKISLTALKELAH